MAIIHPVANMRGGDDRILEQREYYNYCFKKIKKLTYHIFHSIISVSIYKIQEEQSQL